MSNAQTLRELGTRDDIDFALPATCNFENVILPYEMDEAVCM